MVRRIRKAVFPVAGLGTRFLPATKAIPKEMLTVVDKPLVQYAVEEAMAAGIEEFIFVTSRGKIAIEDHFDYSLELGKALAERERDAELEAVHGWLPPPGSIAFTRQREALGLGHAVACARHMVGEEPFAVILPDDLILAKTPCIKQLIEVHEQTGGNAFAVMEVPREHTKRYGVLEVGSDDGRLVEVRGVVEKPDPAEAPSTLCVIGRYVLLPEIFGCLERIDRGEGGEIQLTDALLALIGAAPFHGLRFEGQRFDCGDKVGFLHANICFALAREDMREEIRTLLEESLATMDAPALAPGAESGRRGAPI